MRWIVWGMVLNEARYCRESLLSVLDFADEIHLVEGSTQYSYFCSPYGLSTDNTADIIRSLPGYGTKLHLHRVGWVPTKVELRNMSCRMCHSALNRHARETACLILDLDEVWPSEDFRLADEAFSRDSSLHYIHCELIQLRGDFDHYRDMNVGEGQQEHDLYNERAQQEAMKCRGNVTLRQGRTAERLFRWQPGIRYSAQSHVCAVDQHGRYLYIDPAYTDHREWRPDIKFFHYNYLKPFPETFTKFMYFAQQDGGLKRNDESAVQRALNEGYIKYLFTGTHPKGAWAVSPLPAHLHHPTIMDSHPMRHKTEKAIADPTGEWLVPGAPDIPGYTEKIMAMLKDGSRYVGPDLSKLVV